MGIITIDTYSCYTKNSQYTILHALIHALMVALGFGIKKGRMDINNDTLVSVVDP